MATSEAQPTYVPVDGTVFVYDDQLDVRLERLQERINSMREEGYIAPDIDDQMHERAKNDQIYHSNVLAGIYYDEGGTSESNDDREELRSQHGPEALNLGKALDYVHELSSNVDSQISIQQIHEIHILISEDIESYQGGQYKPDRNKIAGSPYSVPDRLGATLEMQYLSRWLPSASEGPAKIVIQNAAAAHVWLVQAHPFVDGNGRTSRCLMNLILKSNGIPSITIRKQDRERYNASLEQADASDLTPFLELVAERLDAALDDYATFDSETVKRRKLVSALSAQMDDPILAGYQNEYPQWLSSMRRLVDIFGKWVEEFDNASRVEHTRVNLFRYDDDNNVLTWDKFLKLRQRQHEEQTWFFNVDFMQGHRRSAHYRFTFRWSSHHLPESAPISLRVGREVGYKDYRWLDVEARYKRNVPRIREVAYCLRTDRFMVRYSTDSVEPKSIDDIASDFFRDVIRCHFQN